MSFIPYALPMTGNEEIEEVVDTIRSGWLTTGPKTRQFEEEFAKFIGCKHALAVNSATAGLHLGLEALGVGPGDSVITTVHTFTATAEVIRYLGADPIFVDMEGDSFNIDCQQIVNALNKNKNVKAIIPVHYGGQAANLNDIIKIARAFNVKVMDDAAHALPATHRGKLVGTLADVTVFSFYANKTITTGEGGMLVTNDDEIAERVKCMRLHGINKDVFDRFQSTKPSWYYQVVAPGFKYNMTDIAASLGLHQLKKVWNLQERRQYIAEKYNNHFDCLPLRTPVEVNKSDVHSWHLYVIQLELEKLTINRDEFIEKMADAGVGTSVHYIPLHMQPYWRDKYNLSNEMFPRSSEAFERIVSLPNYPAMREEEIEHVINSVKLILKRFSRE